MTNLHMTKKMQRLFVGQISTMSLVRVLRVMANMLNQMTVTTTLAKVLCIGVRRPTTALCTVLTVAHQ